jgi:hypothetical protein
VLGSRTGSSGSLAHTGLQIATYAAIAALGVLLLLLGAHLVRRYRRL